jgi:hypothetical protein
VEHFSKRHGDDAIEIDGWLVYSDGAMRERNPMGALREPPPEPYEACRLRVQYREAKLRRATRAFDERKTVLLRTAHANLSHPNTQPPPCDVAAAKRELGTLRRAVLRCQADLDTARKEMEANKPAWMREREVSAATNRAQNEAFAAAIEAINI